MKQTTNINPFTPAHKAEGKKVTSYLKGKSNNSNHKVNSANA